MIDRIKAIAGKKSLDQNPVEIGFKFGGDIVDPKDPESLAKSCHCSDRTLWYIKVANSGGDAGHFVNPVSLTHVDGDFRKKDRYGRKRYDYKLVTKQVFELYFKFLETRNAAWLRNAERMMISK